MTDVLKVIVLEGHSDGLEVVRSRVGAVAAAMSAPHAAVQSYILEE